MSETADPIHDLSAAKMAQDLGELDGDAVRGKVREYIAAHGLSQSAVGTLAGIAESTFSAWLKGYYKGDNEKVEERVRIWLRSVEVFAGKRKSSLRNMRFAPTVSAQKIITALEHAQALPDIAVISAGAGVGKTATCLHYKRTRPNVFLLTGDPSLHSHGKMLDYLRDILNIPKMPTHKLTRAIADRLSNSQALLIFDEAQHFATKCMDMLRSIHDRGGVGMAFVGNAEVWRRIDGGGRNAELTQLFSRVGIRVTIASPSNKDIEIILDTLEIQDAKQRTILTTIAKEPGALRALDKVLGLALMVADGAGEPLNESHLMKSWSRFSGRRIGLEGA
jgi:DNA transposition AAA+ family ATPase